MSISDWINLILSILSLILAITSIITVVLTLKQNNKMIESNSRPYISVYGDMTNFSDVQFYIIVKNFGKSGGMIKSFSCDIDLSKYNYGLPVTPFENIKGTMIAPNQNIVCNIDSKKLNNDNINVLNFTISYEFCGKIYNETYPINFGAFKKNITTKISTKDKELKTISYTLQEMVQKDL